VGGRWPEVMVTLRVAQESVNPNKPGEGP
jgi:hypothetical protein